MPWGIIVRNKKIYRSELSSEIWQSCGVFFTYKKLNNRLYTGLNTVDIGSCNKEMKMKQFYKDVFVGVFVSFLIVGCYVCYDYVKKLPKPDYRIVTPVPPYDFSSLQSRKVIVFEGREINEKEFIRVLVLDSMADGILTSRVIDSDMEQTSRYFDFNEDGFWERVPYLGNDDQILVHSGNVKDFEPQNILGSCFVSCLQEDVSVFSQLRNLAGGKDTIEAHDDILQKLWVLPPVISTDITEHILALRPLKEKIKLPLKLDVIAAREVTKEGNVLGDYIEVELASGKKSRLREVWLYTDPCVRGYYSPIPVIDEEIKRLPDINGYGTLYSLHEAMQRDVSGQLKNKVREYLEEPNYFTRRQLLRDIIYLWADCQNADPRSRLSENGKNYIGDARKQLFVEKIVGRPFRGTHTGKEETSAPHHASVFYLLDSFNKYADLVGIRLSFWGILNPVIMAAYNSEDGILQGIINKMVLNERKVNTEAVVDFIQTFYAQNGQLQTKLMLFELYKVLKIVKNSELYSSLKGLGEIAEGINMRDMDSFVIEGTANGENLYGTGGNDIFIGRDGNDAFLGREGDDVYIFELNEGDNVIIEEGGNDTIALGADIKPENIDLSLKGKDLLIKINGGENGSIHIRGYAVDDKNKVENLLFADSNIWKLAEKLRTQ